MLSMNFMHGVNVERSEKCCSRCCRRQLASVQEELKQSSHRRYEPNRCSRCLHDCRFNWACHAWEWELVTALDRGQIEPVGDVTNFNESARQSKQELNPRQILQEMEQTHRALRDELAKAPSAFFEPDDPLRKMIDERSILHYDEHGRAIRIWSRGDHSDPS